MPQGVVGHALVDRLLGLDLVDPLAGEIGGDPDLRPVEVDLVVDDVLDLAEVGGDVEVELRRQLGELGFGAAHLQLGVVLLDLPLQLLELLDGMLDLRDVVAVGRLVELELGFVLLELPLRLLELEGELRRRLPLPRLEIGLDLGLEFGDVGLVGLNLTVDPFDEGPVFLQAFAAVLHLVDRLVVFILELGDRIGRPEEVGDLVHLGRKGLPELSEDHRRHLRETDRNGLQTDLRLTPHADGRQTTGTLGRNPQRLRGPNALRKPISAALENAALTNG